MAYINKSDQKAAARRHYLKNKSIIKEKAYVFQISARIRNRIFVNNFLKQNPCIDCGISDIDVLEFDHCFGKKRQNISNMINRACSIKTIEQEIKKCVVRCANCHRKKTRKQFGTERK